MLDPSIEILAAAARAYLRLVTLIAEGEEPDYDAVTELLHDEDIDLELVQQIIDAAIGSRVLVSPEHGLLARIGEAVSSDTSKHTEQVIENIDKLLTEIRRGRWD
jgi:hypothetical protein